MENKEAILRELEDMIKSREKLQNEFEESVAQLSVEDRRKLSNDFWELFGDKYKP
jgi:hypothetical protein